jgi:hypothetical protein
MSKQSKNLSLDEEAVRRAERYSRLHATSVSRLVNDFLSSLPLEPDENRHLSPAVRRLLGIASDAGGRDSYRAYTEKKYRS